MVLREPGLRRTSLDYCAGHFLVTSNVHFAPIQPTYADHVATAHGFPLVRIYNTYGICVMKSTNVQNPRRFVIVHIQRMRKYHTYYIARAPIIINRRMLRKIYTLSSLLVYIAGVPYWEA